MEDRKHRFLQILHGLQGRQIYGTPVHHFKHEFVGHRLAHSQSLMKKDLRGHFGCVNAIEFSSNGKYIASGGDDRRLLLWDVGHSMLNDKTPDVIETLHISNINSCCFDCQDEKIATGGNDGQVIIHDFHVHQSTAVYGLSDAVYCLSADPYNSSILATANDEGKAQIIDTRLSIDTIPFVLADLDSAMHSIMYNPVDPRLLVTANSKHGIGLWDIRMPLKCLNYKSTIQNCMSVRFNSLGDKIMALRRRSGPVLYDIGKPNPIYEFDYRTYYNACTLKSCSFAGLKDEYVMSGSDDFCIYLWKVPTDPSEDYIQYQPHMILKGHRSIVNQVRYCPRNQIIISSGVEKLIKMWSPYSIPGSTGHLIHSRRYGDDDEIERDAYSHEEYIHMVLQAGSFLSHDYTNGTIDEEPCMIAFFDSLIQREIEQTVDDNDEEVVDDNSIRSGEENGNKESDDGSNGNGGDDDGGGGGGGDGGGGDGGGDDGGGGGTRVVRGAGPIQTNGNDAPLCSYDSAASLTIPVANASTSTTADSDNEDSSIRGTAVSESRSRNFYLGLDSSSSDSDSEVDEILSAMYSRYMTSHEQAINSSSRPASKKISSVIARGKQREGKTTSTRRARGAPEPARQKQSCPGRLQRIREDLQHSEDQFLRDNATSMSVLADVIDSFVDNLVPDGSGMSRTLSDTNDGHMSSDSNLNNSSMAEDSRLIGIPTAHRAINRSAVTSTSSRSFSGVSRDALAFSTSVGSSLSANANTRSQSGAIFSRSASVPSSSLDFLQDAHSSNKLNSDCHASNGSTHNSSQLSVHDSPTCSDCHTNGTSGVYGKGKKNFSERTGNKVRASLRDNGCRDIPSLSTFPTPAFHPETVRTSEMQNVSHPACFSGTGRAIDTPGKNGEVQAKFVAPENKPLSFLIKKPSLLSVASSTTLSSSSSSSLSSDPSFTDSYFASSSSLGSDSSKENQGETDQPKTRGDRPGVSNTIVQFKKTKVKGRQFRAKKIDSDSSSEEER